MALGVGRYPQRTGADNRGENGIWQSLSALAFREGEANRGRRRDFPEAASGSGKGVGDGLKDKVEAGRKCEQWSFNGSGADFADFAGRPRCVG